MTALLILAGLGLVAVLARRRPPAVRVSPEWQGQSITEPRLERYAAEREERMAGYARRWAEGPDGSRGRAYVLPFAAGR